MSIKAEDIRSTGFEGNACAGLSMERDDVVYSMSTVINYMQAIQTNDPKLARRLMHLRLDLDLIEADVREILEIVDPEKESASSAPVIDKQGAA